MARKSVRPRSEHTILVVDDQEETLISVRNLLEREGHRVLTADCGARALSIFKENDVHLLLVDYFMPQMTGEQLIREIRAFDPYVQIILQTGYSGQKPPRITLGELDIQGYHDKGDGPERLLLWVDVGLKAYRLIRRVRERERLQGELVANVSHEFRTPLNVINGYTELLLDNQFGALPQEALRPLRRITEAGRNLGELVEDFLKYARVEAGVAETDAAEILTRDVAGEVMRMTETLIEGANIRFAVDLETAPPTFVTDPVKLRTILRNLITNAVKFTPRGNISLRVALDDSALRFSVVDTGPGIRTEDLEIIFEPFRQIDGSATRRHGGIGLGLALSRRLARFLGGDLVVHSEVGHGSTFTLALPASVARAHDAQMALPRRRAAAGLDLQPTVGIS